MKRIPKKSLLKEPQTITVKIDPDELKNGIVLPIINYEVVAKVEMQQVFTGMVTPVPKVLIDFLTKNELRVILLIMDETEKQGECRISSKEMGIRLNLSFVTITSTLYTLRKMGLLLESPNGKKGAGRYRKVNFTALQHLNDLLEGESPALYPRIRNATRKTDILHLSKDDIRNSYNHLVLPPDHDEAEEEEYD